MKRVMFYCQHVLGIGHLVRSAEVVRALSKRFRVLFVVGGELGREFCVPNQVELLQLRPLKTDPEYANLQVCDSSFGLEDTKILRRAELLRTLDNFQPNVLVTELFPFGRKQFSFELLPLLRRARDAANPPLIVSSIRDVLVTKKEQARHEEWVTGLVNGFYDLVLVHGDKRLARLNETFSRLNDLHRPVKYTGYVVKQEIPSRRGVNPKTASSPTIVVSNGSGGCPSGHRLLESVLHVAPELERVIPHEFRVFAGPLMPEEVSRRLEALARPLRNVKFARYTTDLQGELRQTELSVSMAGYNTVMNILSTHVRALVYPVTGNGDQEQSSRAARLEKMGALAVLNEKQLEPTRLAEEIRRALWRKPSHISLNFGGAEKSAALICRFLRLRNGGASQPLPAAWPETDYGTLSVETGSPIRGNVLCD